MFFKIRNSFILVCEIIIFCCVLSAFENVNGKCIIYKSDGTEMTENEWSVGMYIPIIDNWTETSLLASRTKNIKSIEVNLNTIRSNYFNIGLDPVYNLLTINLTDEFANYEVYETVEVVEVKINFDCESSGEKSIVISLPITDSNNHDPEFINAPYEFTMGMPLLKNYSFESHGIAIIARDIDISNKNLSFSLKSDNGKSNGFSILWSGQSSDNRNKPIFKAILITTELIDLHENVTFTIAAQDTGQPVRETNTTITINVDRARSTLMFSKSLYIADCRSAEVGKDADIVFDQKIVILRGAELNINITILSNPTGYEQNFQYEMVYETSMISLKLKNPPVTLLTMNSMLLELQISKIGSLTSTVLFIKLPGISDSTFPPKLYFKSEFHRLEKDFSFTGTLIAEKADLENVNGDINYSIRYESIGEDEKISIDRISGEVKVIKMLSPGIYTFDIIANVTEHNLSARTKVLLVITHKEIDYALRIIEVEEESPHKDILSLGSEFCDYTIQSQTPDKGWFYLVKNSLYSNAIDRESTDFLNYSSAQVRLEIEVICPSNHLNDKQVKRATEYNVAIGNILFNYSQMHIIAIITDINDNEPVWDTQIPKTIGYLAKELSKFVLTPCVYNLSATDSDEAENAIITYSVKENVAFYVHPNIGSLYINLNAKMTEYVTVIASDGVHSSFLNISLKSLKSDNMVALYVTDAVIEDVEHIVAEIQKNLTTCIIGYIGAGVINNFNINSNIKKAKNKGTRNIMIQILIYGLDQQTHIPLSHTNLISVLNDYGVSNFAHIMKISALGDAEESNVLLITTITLGACLGILIIGAATYFTRQRLCK